LTFKDPRWLTFFGSVEDAGESHTSTMRFERGIFTLYVCEYEM